MDFAPGRGHPERGPAARRACAAQRGSLSATPRESTMRFERTIDIDAPPERVWEVLSDAQRWPEWTPTVTRVELLEGDGKGIGSRFRIHQPKLPAAVFVLTAVEPGRSFTWENGNFVARARAHHMVEARGAGARATLALDCSGLLGGLMVRMYRKLIREYLDLEAEGLKRRSEGKV